MSTYQIQIAPFAKQIYKEIQLHLLDGEVLSISLLDAEMIDMGNGHLFIIGKVLEHVAINNAMSVKHPIEVAFWKH